MLYEVITICLEMLDDKGCRTNDTVNVTVHRSPEVDLGRDTTLCADEMYIIDLPEFRRYEWSTGNRGASQQIYANAGQIWVMVTNDYNCTGSDTLFVGECDPNKLFKEITNTFTPNGDDVHDKWEIKNIDLFPDTEISIFNRTGTLIYHCTGGYANDWDGTYRGKELPMDTYYYIIDFKAEGMKPIKGTVTIVR